MQNFPFNITRKWVNGATFRLGCSTGNGSFKNNTFLHAHKKGISVVHTPIPLLNLILNSWYGNRDDPCWWCMQSAWNEINNRRQDITWHVEMLMEHWICHCVIKSTLWIFCNLLDFLPLWRFPVKEPRRRESYRYGCLPLAMGLNCTSGGRCRHVRDEMVYFTPPKSPDIVILMAGTNNIHKRFGCRQNIRHSLRPWKSFSSSSLLDVKCSLPQR